MMGETARTFAEKGELLTFLGYLRERPTQNDHGLLQCIRAASDSEDAYRAASKWLVREDSKGNFSKKKIPDLYYAEDVRDHLAAQGIAPDSADEIARVIATGRFGQEYAWLLRKIPSLREWVSGVRHLPSREDVVKELPCEYAAFCEEGCGELAFEEESRRGMGAYYLWQRRFAAIQYDKAREAAVRKKPLTVPACCLVLPNEFTEAQMLYDLAEEWARRGFDSHRRDGLTTTVSVGYYCHREIEAGFDEKSLCVYSTAIRGEAAKCFAECIMRGIGVGEAYLKDAYQAQHLYKITLKECGGTK